jgi:hypothetical protein
VLSELREDILVSRKRNTDLVLILDTPEEVILFRTQEVSVEEVERQWQFYRHLVDKISNAILVRTDQGIPQTTREASQLLAGHLIHRMQ